MKRLLFLLRPPFGEIAAAGPPWAGRLAAAGLAFGCFCGLAGLLHFLLLPAGLIGRWWALPAVALAAAAAGAGFLGKTPGSRASDAPPAPRWVRPLGMITAAMGLLVLGAQLIAARAAPYGQWDAFAIWNLRALFLAGPAEAWRHAASGLVVEMHPEYPPLHSSLVAVLWKLGGSPGEPAVPLALGLAFFWAAAGLLVGFLGLLRGAATALLACLALATTAPLLEQSTWQYADIPLAFYFLAALGLLALSAAEPELERTLLPLSGLFAGFAACTKDEGIAFLLAVPVSWALIVWRKEGLRRAQGKLGLWAAGAAGPALVSAAFKLFLAPPVTPLRGQTFAQVLEKIGDPERYRLILGGFFRGVLELGNGPTHPLLILAALAVVLRLGAAGPLRSAAAPSAAVLGLMLAAYFAVYLTTPDDLSWRLNTSLIRLYVQLWPSALLAFFLAVRPVPDTAPSAEREPGARAQRKAKDGQEGLKRRRK